MTWTGGVVDCRASTCNFVDSDADRVGERFLEIFHATNALGGGAFFRLSTARGKFWTSHSSLMHADGGTASVTAAELRAPSL